MLGGCWKARSRSRASGVSISTNARWERSIASRPPARRVRRQTPTYTSVRAASRRMSREAPGALCAAMNRRPMSR